jgi:hypothetical protein
MLPLFRKNQRLYLLIGIIIAFVLQVNGNLVLIYIYLPSINTRSKRRSGCLPSSICERQELNWIFWINIRDLNSCLSELISI